MHPHTNRGAKSRASYLLPSIYRRSRNETPVVDREINPAVPPGRPLPGHYVVDRDPCRRVDAVIPRRSIVAIDIGIVALVGAHTSHRLRVVVERARARSLARKNSYYAATEVAP